MQLMILLMKATARQTNYCTLLLTFWEVVPMVTLRNNLSYGHIQKDCEAFVQISKKKKACNSQSTVANYVNHCNPFFENQAMLASVFRHLGVSLLKC